MPGHALRVRHVLLHVLLILDRSVGADGGGKGGGINGGGSRAPGEGGGLSADEQVGVGGYRELRRGTCMGRWVG